MSGGKWFTSRRTPAPGYVRCLVDITRDLGRSAALYNESDSPKCNSGIGRTCGECAAPQLVLPGMRA